MVRKYVKTTHSAKDYFLEYIVSTFNGKKPNKPKKEKPKNPTSLENGQKKTMK